MASLCCKQGCLEGSLVGAALKKSAHRAYISGCRHLVKLALASFCFLLHAATMSTLIACFWPFLCIQARMIGARPGPYSITLRNLSGQLLGRPTALDLDGPLCHMMVTVVPCQTLAFFRYRALHTPLLRAGHEFPIARVPYGTLLHPNLAQPMQLPTHSLVLWP